MKANQIVMYARVLSLVAMEEGQSAVVAAGMVARTALTGGAMRANQIAINALVLGLVVMEEEAVSRSVEEQLTLPVPQIKLVSNSCGAQREIVPCIALHMAEVETLVT